MSLTEMMWWTMRLTRSKESLQILIYGEIWMPRQGLDLLMTAKYFERIGDHAVNIAEWVEYSITGQHRNNEHQDYLNN